MFISIRDVVLPHGGFASVVEGLKALELNAIEVEVWSDMTVMSVTDPRQRISIGSDDGLKVFESELQGHGIIISAFLVSNDFGKPDVDEEVGWVTQVVKTAFRLDIPAVRVDAVMRGWEALGLDGAVRLFAENIKRVLDATDDTGIALGIENHGSLGNRPEFLQAVLEAVSSQRLGLTLDSGNFYWFGHPLSHIYEIQRQFASSVKHTHIKNICYPEELREQQRPIGYEYDKFVSPIYEGDIDHAIVVGILKKAGYDGDLCIEDESLGKFTPDERRQILKKDVEHLKSLLL